MDQLELLKKILRLPQHWQVVDVDTDEETRQLTVNLHFVRTRRRLLGGEARACARCGQALPPTPASRYLRLRHLPIGDWQVYLRLPDSTTGCADRACPASAELAEPGTRVTHAFASRMVALHTGGASLVSTAALLDVEVSDVAVVLAARGMPVDALTGEIALVDQVLSAEWDDLADGGPSADALADSAGPDVEQAPATVAAEPTPARALPPIAASVSGVELLPSADGVAQASNAISEELSLASPPQPVPTDTLLAADEAQAQAAFDEAIEGETDALAQETIDEHTQTGATLIGDVDEVGAADAVAEPDAENANAQAWEEAPVASDGGDGEAVVAAEASAPSHDESDAVAAVDASADGADGPGTSGESSEVGDAVGAEVIDQVPAAGTPDTKSVSGEGTAGTTESDQPAAPEPTGVEHAAVPVLPARARVPELPPVEHAVWAALLGGDLNLNTEALALQMLLARLRQFVRTSADKSAVSAAARVLHKHLGQSAQRYAGERAQLLAAMKGQARTESAGEAPDKARSSTADPVTGRGGAGDGASAAERGGIPTLQPRAPAATSWAVPPINHPVWGQLVTGQRPLSTSSVALKMMLEQIRRSAQSDPSDATRLAGVRLLHTFFTKTSRQLTSELRQLLEGANSEGPTSAPPPPSPTPGVDNVAPVEAVPVVQPRIPPETSPSWQALLDGRVVPSQEDPGLSMLMEKVRRVTSQGETSGEVMAAAARVLRRYLARYARRHVDLLAELNSLDLSTTTTQRTSRLSRTWRGGGRRGAQATSVADVPPVEDPVWRRLMDGDLLLETDAFALRMMLERIRRSVRRDPSESNRQAAALQLRDYFVKHERVHRAELQRIRAA